MKSNCLNKICFLSVSLVCILSQALNAYDTYSSLNYYDKNDRLVGQEFSAGFSIGYEYDGNGNIVRKVLLGEDDNSDNVPDILQFINGVSLTEPIDLNDDTDGDGWTDWQELLAGSDMYSADSQPSLSGTTGEELKFTDESGNLQSVFGLSFKPTRWVMATGELDGQAGDEIVIGADGDTGGNENFLHILYQRATGWTLEKVSVGDCGITSISIGDPGTGSGELYIGLRNPIQKGSIGRVHKDGDAWVLTTIGSCLSEEAYVYGIREQQSLVVCCRFEEGNGIFTLSPEDDWTQHLEDECSEISPFGAVIKSHLSFYDGAGAIVYQVDANTIRVRNTPRNGFLEEGLVAYYPFSNDTYDYGGEEYDPVVTGTRYTDGQDEEPNGALYFDGDDLLAVDGVEELGFDASEEDYSVCLWAKPEDVNQGILIENKSETGREYEGFAYKMYLDADGYFEAEMWNPAYSFDINAPDVNTTDTWYHIAFIVRDQICRLYINGQLVGYDPKKCGYSTKNTGGIQIGDGYIGALDEIRIYNRALHPTELRYLYDQYVGVHDIPIEGDGERTFLGAKQLAALECSSLEDEEIQIDEVTRFVTQGTLPGDPNYASEHTTIQAAIDDANDGDTILVDDGDYGPIVIDKKVVIKSLNGRDVTKIQGGGPRCITMNVPAEVHGFTIHDGTIPTSGDNSYKGGGVYMAEGGVLKNCIVENCSGHQSHIPHSLKMYGGGVYSEMGGVFEGCFIRNNSISGSVTGHGGAYVECSGAGAYCNLGRFHNCVIEDNYISSSGLEDGSSGACFGGGIFSELPSYVESCCIRNNYLSASGIGAAGSEGAGVYRCVLANSVILNNEARAYNGDYQSGSGGASSSTLYNCVVLGNSSSPIGGSPSNVDVVGGVRNCQICNSIICQNGGGDEIDRSTIRHSLIWNDSVSDDTDIDEISLSLFDQDPLFVDADGEDDVLGTEDDDLRLMPESPCIDAGNNEYVITPADLDNNERISGDAVDIGPYENGSTPHVAAESIDGDHSTVISFARIGDEDGSGTLTAGDHYLVDLIALGEAEYTSLQREQYVLTGSRLSEQFSLAAIESNDEYLIFSAEPGGSVYSWQFPRSRVNGSAIGRDLFTSQYEGMGWHALSGLRGFQQNQVLAGLMVNPADTKSGHIVMWDLAQGQELVDQGDPNTFQSAPEVEILPDIAGGGQIGKIKIRIADDEHNSCTPVLQYQIDGESEWHYATINAPDGQSYDSSPNGVEHTILWDAGNDLGTAFSGVVNLRVSVEDVASTGSWSGEFEYELDTSDTNNVPEITIIDYPEYVKYEEEEATISGSANQYITGQMWGVNLRNDAHFDITGGLTWQATGIPLEQGENLIEVYGVNSDGFVTSDSVTIRRGRYNVPEISVSSATVHGGLAVLEGTCNEYVIRIELANTTTGYSTILDANSPWRSSPIPIVAGENHITATAYNMFEDYTIVETLVVGENSEWYVDINSASTDPNGSMTEPYASIQEAIDSAIAGDSICAAKGQYHENISITKDMHLYGGFIADDWSTPRNPKLNGTIIRGQGGSVVYVEDANATISGFTITEGNNVPMGAGVYCSSVDFIQHSVVVSECTIENNLIQGDYDSALGAGVYCSGSISLTMSGNVVRFNSIYNDNALYAAGAGVYCDTSGDNQFINNLIVDNLITMNSPETSQAAGLWAPSSLITNNTIASNSITAAPGASTSAAGILADDQTIIENTIVWGNSPDQIEGHDCNNVHYSNIAGNVCDTMNGNIFADPLFVDIENEDYHLQSLGGHWDAGYDWPDSNDRGAWITDFQTSPCIDAGNPNMPSYSELFHHGFRINMGTYGGTEQASLSWPVSALDFSDLAVFASRWLDADTPSIDFSEHDLNRDGVVNFGDYSQLFAYWQSTLYRLDIDVNGPGVVLPETGGYYMPDVVVRLKVEYGYARCWLGTDDDNPSEPTSNTVTMTGNRNVTVVVDAISPRLMEGLWGCWPLDTDANDVHGTNHGTVYPDAHPVTEGQKLGGGAFSFSASSNSYIDLGGSLLPELDDFTVNIWVCSQDLNPGTLISQYSQLGNTEGQIRFLLNTGDGLKLIIQHTSGQDSHIGFGAIASNEWHMVTLRRQAEAFAVSVDGTNREQQGIQRLLEPGQIINAENTWLGADRSGPDAFSYEGLMDEVAIWRRALAEEEISILYAGGDGMPYPWQSLLDGLLSWWPLDTDANDVHGTNHGTVYPDAHPVTEGQKLGGGAFSFSASSNSYIDLGGSLLPELDDFTVNIWVCSQDLNPGTLISQYSQLGNTEGQIRFLLNTGDGLKLIIQHTSGQDSHIGFGAIASNEWHMVTLRRQAEAFAVSVDGTNREQQGIQRLLEPGQIINAENTWLGADRSGPDAFSYEGLMDEVAIWRRALAEEEISILYAGGDGMPYP